MKVFHEDRVDELLDDHGVLLPAAAQEPGVGELVEAGRLAAAAPLPLLVVQKEIVSCLLDFVLFDVKFLMCSFDNLTGTYPM